MTFVLTQKKMYKVPPISYLYNTNNYIGTKHHIFMNEKDTAVSEKVSPKVHIGHVTLTCYVDHLQGTQSHLNRGQNKVKKRFSHWKINYKIGSTHRTFILSVCKGRKILSVIYDKIAHDSEAFMKRNKNYE